MLDVDRLYLVARTLLDEVIDHYATEGVDLPERRYVAPGPPAWDCDQVVAYVERTYAGAIGQRAESPLDCLAIRSAVVAVEVVRCTPMVEMVGNQVQIPAPAEMEQSAMEVLADPGLIVNAVLEAYRAGRLGGCKSIAVVDWEQLGPQGGYVGGRQRFTWNLTAAP